MENISQNGGIEMRRREFLILALAQLHVTDAGQRIAVLKAEIPRMMESTQVPGLSIAVIHDARILWRQGFGVKLTGSNQHVDNDTVFDVGSVSKTVFAYVVMKHCERGILNLDTPLIEIMAPKPSDRFRLRKDTIAEMVRPQIQGGDSPDSWRALGWEVVRTDKDDLIVHGGDNSGFHAFAAASIKRRTGYVFMTNGDGGMELLKKLIVGDTPLNQLLDA
jgi:hypothetical protein